MAHPASRVLAMVGDHDGPPDDSTGRGHGAVLLRACITEAREVGGDVLWLGVWECNERAHRFSARHGFRWVGVKSFVDLAL